MLTLLEFLFNNVAKKENPKQVVFYEICEFFENTYFEEHLRMATSIEQRILKIMPCLELSIVKLGSSGNLLVPHGFACWVLVYLWCVARFDTICII